MAAPKKPGGNAGKGRKAGVPNKLTKDLKAMVLGALEANGGQRARGTDGEEPHGVYDPARQGLADHARRKCRGQV